MMKLLETSDGILSGFYTQTSIYVHEQVGWEKNPLHVFKILHE